MTPEEIRKKKTDFDDVENQLRKELVMLKLQSRLGTCSDPSKIKKVKKDIARILTIKKEEGLKGAKT